VYRDVSQEGEWPQTLQLLSTGSDAEFGSIVVPLALMTRLTYTSTWGSYFNVSDANATVDGWTRPGPEANPIGGGMRALTFVQRSTGRGVIAFRGTDLGASLPSHQADLCADDFLGGVPLPDACTIFSTHTLDYLARALELAAAAVEAHPDVEFLYTGHSLGGLLAEVVAAVRGALAVGFAVPPVVPVLRNRTTVAPSDIPAWRAVALFNEWDPLRFEAVGQLTGSQCFWPVHPTPEGCEQCEGPGHVPDMSSSACRLCFVQTHIYAFYLGLVKSGRRPVCEERVSADRQDDVRWRASSQHSKSVVSLTI